MASAKEILGGYVDRLEKIIIDYNYDEDGAYKLLEEFKGTISEKHNLTGEEKELFEACTYNVLATINTVLQQEKKSRQLLMALTEAKEEMKAIIEFM